MPKHFVILKQVNCSLLGQICGDLHPYNNPMMSDCKNCAVYNEWKESKLSLEDYLSKYEPLYNIET